MGRPKRPTDQLQVRLAAGNKHRIKALAMALGFSYGKGGDVGALLDALCGGDYVLVKSEKISDKGLTE